MSNLVPAPAWSDIPQFETTTPALGGASGPMNFQAQALANRFGYLESNRGSSRVGFSQLGLNFVQRTAEQKLQDVVDAKDYATLADAFIASSRVFVTSAINVTANTTVPKGKALIFTPSGSLNVSSGVTVTIRCVVEAPLTRIFTGSGSVVGIREVYPEWWGALGTGSGDDIAALDAAHTCVQGSQASEGAAPTIWLRGVQYQVTRGWIVRPTAYVPLRVIGNGTVLAGSRIIAASTFTPAGPAFQIAGSTDPIEMIADWVLHGVAVFPSAGGRGAATVGLQIGSDAPNTKLIGYHQSLVEDVLVTGFPTCIRIIHARLARFDRVSAWNNGFVGANQCVLIEQLGGSTGDLTFNDGNFVGSSTTALDTHAVSIRSASGAYNAGTGASQVSGLNFNDCDFHSGGRSVSLYCGAGSWLTDVWFTKPQVDQVTTNAFYLESNNSGSNLENINLDHHYVALTLGDSIVATSTGSGGTIQTLNIGNGWIDRSTGASVKCVGTAVQGVTVDNNTISNSQSTDSVFEFNGTKSFTCTNNKAVRPLGGTHAAYFIKILSGCNHFTAVGNVSGGFTSLGVVSDASGAVTKYLAGNI